MLLFDMIQKVEKEGDECKSCGTPVIKTKSRRKPKPHQKYYYEYYLRCPNPECKTTMYMVDEWKREVITDSNENDDFVLAFIKASVKTLIDKTKIIKTLSIVAQDL